MPLDVFSKETTYKDDYRTPKPVPHKIYMWPRSWVEEVKAPPKTPERQIDYEALLPRCQEVPFTHGWLPKPILRTNPRETFVVKEIPRDDELTQQVRKTRPQYVMPPGVTIDNADEVFEDEESVLMVRTAPYVTTYQKLLEDVKKPKESFLYNVEYSTLEEDGDKATLKMILHKSLPPGWMECANDWDRVQSRAIGKPNEDFWREHGPKVKIQASDNDLLGPVDPAIIEKVEELDQQDRLRMAYNIPKPGYQGYVPRSVYGVSMEKEKRSAIDPRVTTYQAFCERLASKKLC